jgi:hypothetical protein
LIKWGNHTHFEELRRFRLFVRFETLETLVEMAETGKFSMLHDIDITPRTERHVIREIKNEMYELLSLLLLKLNPLTSLTIGTFLNDKVWQSIVNHHGRTLQMLFLCDFNPTREQVVELPQLCPDLQKMELRLQRSGGDKYEMDMYRAFGHLPKLKQISLQVDCSVYDPNPP